MAWFYAWTSREEEIFIERRIVMVWQWQWGSKDDADPIFWPERNGMYEKEPTPLRGLQVGVGWGLGRCNVNASSGFQKEIEVQGRG